MKNNRAIKIRSRFFIAGEGHSEQSFIKWLQGLTEEQGLSLHLDYRSLDGGGYESMFRKTLKARTHGLTGNKKYLYSFLLVDADRADRGDCAGDWNLNQLRREAKKHNIDVCVQKPNLEGLILAMLLDDKKSLYPVSPSATKVKHHLQTAWPEYEKPMDTLALSQKFSISDLKRVTAQDPDWKNLLTKIGLIFT